MRRPLFYAITAVFPLACTALVGCDGPSTTSDAALEPTDAGPDDAASAVDAALVCEVDVEPEAPLADPPRHTPRWAFEPWISKDISDRADTLAFVQGFRDRDIPVGVVVLDSPWDTNYTNFEPNPSRYPDFTELVDTLHEDDVRIVLWVTQMTNRSSYDLETGGDTYDGSARTWLEGRGCGFFVQDGKVYGWWKGRGSGVDFFDARARAWWHQQQEYLLMEAGIDGWKLDFGESYMEDDATLATESGPVEFQAYSEEYYRDYLAYAYSRRGREFTTMVRPWDVSYDRRGRFHARPEHAPVGWVGDNQRDWSGIADALDHIHRSAAAGYVVLGSDLGGYLDRDQNNLTVEIPFDLEVFDRWTSLSAMTPFFELHGRGNLAPWTVPVSEAEQAQTVAIYRYWATLHHAMVPYWYSLAEDAYARSAADGALHAILHPVGDETSWAGDYAYSVGEQFFVAPIVAAGGVRDVTLPSDGRYYDWWVEGGDAIDGGTTLSDYDASDLQRIPLFVREGAIVPMVVDSDALGLETPAGASALTFAVWPSEAETRFTLYETVDAETDTTTTIAARRDGTTTAIAFEPARDAAILRIRHDALVAGVFADGRPLTAVLSREALDATTEGYFYDASARMLWVHTTSSTSVVQAEALVR